MIQRPGLSWGRLALLAGIAHFLLVAGIGLSRHWAYLSSINDLGVFDQAIWGLFNGVAPFVRTLQRDVSAHLAIRNLGWIVASPEIHKANCEGFPIALQSLATGRASDPVMAQLDQMAVDLGLSRPSVPKRVVDYLMTLDADAVLLDQLEVLSAMHRDTATLQVRDNFAYIARRALHVLKGSAPDFFGQRRLLTPLELCELLAASARSASHGSDDGGSGEARLP